MESISPETLKLWESGVLGDLERSIVANIDINPKRIETKPYGIRMPVSLMESIKQIAFLHEVSYQELIRDVLTRFATSEMQYMMKKEIEKKLNERTKRSENEINNEIIEKDTKKESKEAA
jgi:hypothetical protein